MGGGRFGEVDTGGGGGGDCDVFGGGGGVGGRRRRVGWLGIESFDGVVVFVD